MATLPGRWYHVLPGHRPGRLISADTAPYYAADAEREHEAANRASNAENYRRQARLHEVAAALRAEIAARAADR